MEKNQIQVTDANRIDFYQSVYPTDNSVDLSEFKDFDCVLIDCVGGKYRKLFTDHKIHVVETVTSAKQFKFDTNDFNKLVDNRVDDVIAWPSLVVKNSIVIFNFSPLLKYLSVDTWRNFITSAGIKYDAQQIIVKQNLMFLDDCRMHDRFYQIANLQFPNYVVKKFVYDTTTSIFELIIKRVTDID